MLLLKAGSYITTAHVSSPKRSTGAANLRATEAVHYPVISDLLQTSIGSHFASPSN